MTRKKKLTLILLPSFVILFVFGYGIYHFAAKYASDKLVDTVANELESSGEIEKIKKSIENDPALKKFVEETEAGEKKMPSETKDKSSEPSTSPAASTTSNNTSSAKEKTETVAESKLPFTTKEEATKVVIAKVGITDLKEIQSGVQKGTVSKEEAIQAIKSKLTEEELQALKVIAYKELNK